jgi:hypothetical protein
MLQIIQMHNDEEFNSSSSWFINFSVASPKAIIATLTLRSWPRQGFVMVRAKNETWESHFMLSGV